MLPCGVSVCLFVENSGSYLLLRLPCFFHFLLLCRVCLLRVSIKKVVFVFKLDRNCCPSPIVISGVCCGVLLLDVEIIGCRFQYECVKVQRVSVSIFQSLAVQKWKRTTVCLFLEVEAFEFLYKVIFLALCPCLIGRENSAGTTENSPYFLFVLAPTLRLFVLRFYLFQFAGELS